MAAVSVWLCLAPVSLARHALRVRDAAEAGKTGEARKAVSMIVGRDTSLLDMHGVCRACVESVAENLTDGVLCTLFWAMAGGLIAGFPGAAALAMAERATSTLDALWGRRDRRYRHFGTFGARLDDVFTYLPARLALPAISLAAFSVKASPAAVFRTGWRFRHAHESPNSAWSEAPFAAALGLRLGGPAVYAGMKRDHPWLARHTGRGIRPYLPGRPAHVGLSHHFYPGLVSRPGLIQLKKQAAAVSTSENSGRVTSVRRADYFRLSTISFEIWKLWASSGNVPAFTSPQ